MELKKSFAVLISKLKKVLCNVILAVYHECRTKEYKGFPW